MFAVLGGVGERAESFPLEIGNCLGIGLEVDHVARDQPDHPSIDKDALATEHAANRDRPEFAKEFVDRLGVHAWA